MRGRFPFLTATSVTVAGLFLGAAPEARENPRPLVARVLLISVDGMHAVDLSRFIATHGGGALAELSRRGMTYASALSSAPSDSFPGLLAQVTGGSPKSTGVFYDVSYDRTLYASGSNCQGPRGTQVIFDESIDKDTSSVTGGGALGRPRTQIDASKLPRSLVNGACVPVYPHSFVKVNTLFEVIRAQGGRTAWSDKHPAYDLVNGPSGEGVDDLFAPEVASNDPVTGADTTKGFHSIQRNDRLKVRSLLNEIAGKDSTGTQSVGVPTIFGMNFQAVSVGQKLAAGNNKDPADAGLIGGYADIVGRLPNNGLAQELEFVVAEIGAIVRALNRANLFDSTLIIVSAKHGQSPINLKERKALDDGPYASMPGYAASITDDVGLVWLKPQAQKADYAAARQYLSDHAEGLGVAKLLDRSQLADLYQDPFRDNRTPDFIAVTKHGVIYTSGSKLAEHGGFSDDDRHVALLVSSHGLDGRTIDTAVSTQQIAPTILRSLDIDPRRLAAIRIEHTLPLPGIEGLGGR